MPVITFSARRKSQESAAAESIFTIEHLPTCERFTTALNSAGGRHSTAATIELTLQGAGTCDVAGASGMCAAMSHGLERLPATGAISSRQMHKTSGSDNFLLLPMTFCRNMYY